MESRVRLVATLLVLSCPFLSSPGAAQESSASPSDLPSLDHAPEFLDAVRDGAAASPAIRRASLEDPWVTSGPAESWQQRVRTALTPGAEGGARARLAGDDAFEALPSGDASTLELPSFLPLRLRNDLHRMETRIRELRTVLFGHRGIFRLGENEESGASRFRLNLQYDPEPGLRFVLLTH
jgi:hypothetical protein